MFATLAKKVSKDRDLPERAWRLEVLSRVLNGKIYDTLPHPFHAERTDSGEYVPLRDRRPCVRYNLSKLIVDDVTSLLFGEGRFPSATADNKNTVDGLASLVAECKLPQVMHEAAWRGSIGSVAILFRVLKERPYFSVLPTLFLAPEWNPEAPDELLKVTERYKVRGSDLAARGYDVEDDALAADFWFKRVWDASAETWFVPFKVADEDEAKEAIDTARTVQHDLGFVPIVWIKNLPSGDDIDGACTFEPAIETQIEIEYQLSQAGRGLKYSSDPLLMLREPVGGDGASMVRSASNAIVVAGGEQGTQGGDAKLLEINGTAANAVIEYVRALREMALEVCHGNRSNADKVSAAQSGKALELLHQPLLQQADVLRSSYGVNGLLPLLRMVCAASRRVTLRLRNTTLRDLSDEGLGLRWPPWFQPTNTDLRDQASTLGSLKNNGMISRETAVNIIAPSYDMEDPAAELARIAADEAAADARAAAQAAQVKATEVIPD